MRLDEFESYCLGWSEQKNNETKNIHNTSMMNSHTTSCLMSRILGGKRIPKLDKLLYKSENNEENNIDIKKEMEEARRIIVPELMSRLKIK